MNAYEPRAVSYPGVPGKNQRPETGSRSSISRYRADSLPEPRTFHHLRRHLDLDSDLDQPAVDYNDVEEIGHTLRRVAVSENLYREENQDKNRKTITILSVASAPPQCSLPHLTNRISSPTIAVTHIPWNNWTKWSYERGKRPHVLIGPFLSLVLRTLRNTRYPIQRFNREI